jgi:hypothetical protein
VAFLFCLRGFKVLSPSIQPIQEPSQMRFAQQADFQSIQPLEAKGRKPISRSFPAGKMSLKLA